jgi:hypothetical protein
VNDAHWEVSVKTMTLTMMMTMNDWFHHDFLVVVVDDAHDYDVVDEEQAVEGTGVATVATMTMTMTMMTTMTMLQSLLLTLALTLTLMMLTRWL